MTFDEPTRHEMCLMGLTEAVGYEIRPVNGAQRLFQKGASTKAGAWTFSKLAHRVDRRLLALTHGRTAVATLVAGLPIITVTTTGAKSGLPRSLPLLGIPIEGDLALIGTNFGQSNTPGWVYNLEADPTGRVAYRNRDVGFIARRANPEETETALTAAARVYPGYDKYRERITGREVKVFVLAASEA
ncbi:MAG: nitroreductase family deazaflavin-dependent oxidoreductase [Acidimicrobiia bacterium]|nr:nitroreductase family deazaflavin-dependent oxidoreductase [Acidimicrobiia bacterium]